jgi:hypothetical protein
VPVLSTLAVAGAKKVAEIAHTSLPRNYLPALSALAGAILEALSATTVIPGLPPGLSGALLGLAGVGAREVIDQLRNYGMRPVI